jgi:hypothetical protein
MAITVVIIALVAIAGMFIGSYKMDKEDGYL